MKVKCNKCGKVVNRVKSCINKNIAQLGIELQDYIRIYQCKECRPNRHLDWSTITKILDPTKDVDLIEKYKDKLESHR